MFENKLILAIILVIVTFKTSIGEKIITCDIDKAESTCEFKSVVILKDETVKVVANHSTNLTKNDDIKEVIFESSFIYYIPSEIFKTFKNLEKLNITGQHLEEIYPETFVEAKTLKNLYLDYNYLKAIGVNCFKGATNLWRIELGDNQIERIHSTAFGALKKLGFLRLWDNKIGNIHQNTFQYMAIMGEVVASSNKLQFLHKNLFRNNINMNWINFYRNEIDHIKSNMFLHLTRPMFINLEDNECIDEIFYSGNIERELMGCSTFYNEVEGFYEAVEKADDVEGMIDLMEFNMNKKFKILQNEADNQVKLLKDLTRELEKIKQILGSKLKKNLLRSLDVYDIKNPQISTKLLNQEF